MKTQSDGQMLLCLLEVGSFVLMNQEGKKVINKPVWHSDTFHLYSGVYTSRQFHVLFFYFR